MTKLPTDIFGNVLAGGLALPQMPNFAVPTFDLNLDIPQHVKNPAAWTYERLVSYINQFELSLDQDHEIGARLVSFGANVTFHIQDLGFWGPDIISFNGVDDAGNRVQLIQHVTQLSVLLVSMKKIADQPRRIGFDLTQKLNAEKD